MAIASTEKVYHAVKNKKALSTGFSAIDHGKPFIPETLTQLYHTNHYSSLTQQQQLRYNQLFAMRAIEQLMTLEARFIELVVSRSQKTRPLKDNQQLRYCMQEMIVEEAEHYRMFRSLNKLAEPAIYGKNDMFFAHMSLVERATLELLGRTPGITSFLLWSLLILEEFSTYISRQMIQCRHGVSGELEDNFLMAHREHLKDETRHVSICANAIIRFLDQSSNLSRRLNARLLRHFMHEYMTPKRGGLRVIRRLCEEFPELRPKEPEMMQTVRSQRRDPVIWGAINNASAMPASNELMQRFPEFSLLSQ